MVDCPILAWTCDTAFALLPDEARTAAADGWIADHLAPVLAGLDPTREHVVGGDVARHGDLTWILAAEIGRDLVTSPAVAIEARDVPFAEQLQVLVALLGGLPRLRAAALDAGGNGAMLAERARQIVGPAVVEVTLSQAFYLDRFPKYRAGLEDGSFLLPRSADVEADHRLVRVEGGIPHIPKARTTGTDGGQRHGDSAIAGLLAHFAQDQDPVEIAFHPVPLPRRRGEEIAPDVDPARPGSLRAIARRRLDLSRQGEIGVAGGRGRGGTW